LHFIEALTAEKPDMSTATFVSPGLIDLQPTTSYKHLTSVAAARNSSANRASGWPHPELQATISEPMGTASVKWGLDRAAGRIVRYVNERPFGG